MSEEPAAKRIKPTQAYDDLKDLFPEDWKQLLANEFEKPYFSELVDSLNFVAKCKIIIYPQRDNIFRAFIECAFRKVKVVILAQDPFHGVNQAEGLCFSVGKSVATPPSLTNIYKELENDVKGWTRPNHGNLLEWARRGVLLLNSVLTVSAGEAGSHSELGWEHFTDAVIDVLSSKRQNLVFLLWGKYAQTKSRKIDKTRHLLLCCGHPSPFSERMFFGNKHFSKTNHYLTEHGIEPIDWAITDTPHKCLKSGLPE